MQRWLDEGPFEEEREEGEQEESSEEHEAEEQEEEEEPAPPVKARRGEDGTAVRGALWRKSSAFKGAF